MDLGPTTPRRGRELKNARLAFALQRTGAFAPADLAAFGLGEMQHGLQPSDYIWSKGAYYRPADPSRARVDPERGATILATRPPPVGGRSRVGSRDPDGAGGASGGPRLSAAGRTRIDPDRGVVARSTPVAVRRPPGEDPLRRAMARTSRIDPRIGGGRYDVGR